LNVSFSEEARDAVKIPQTHGTPPLKGADKLISEIFISHIMAPSFSTKQTQFSFATRS